MVCVVCVAVLGNVLRRDAGLNIIRVWGGGIAERQQFYDACDELGVLVHQEVRGCITSVAVTPFKNLCIFCPQTTCLPQ